MTGLNGQTGSLPGLADIVDRPKYDVWANLRGNPGTEAQQAYIKLVECLKR